MRDALEISSHGVDTVRASFRVLDAIPVTDESFREEIMASGFRAQSQDWVEDGQRIRSERFVYQDPDNSTLRYCLRGGEYLETEFSAPRLLDNSPVNLSLANPDQVRELVGSARGRARALIPGQPDLGFVKFNRLDYACDLAAGQQSAGVISAAAQFRFPGANKSSTHVYPGETATVRTDRRTFRTYAKGYELEAKLKPGQREEYASVIQLSKEAGMTRMELSDRTKGGLAIGALHHGAFDFSERLERGFNGGRVFISGLAGLEAEIASRGLSSQRESTLLKFATRYAVLGEDGMKQRYSRPTFYRHKRMFLDAGLSLGDICVYEGEIDFRPVIQQLRVA